MRFCSSAPVRRVWAGHEPSPPVLSALSSGEKRRMGQTQCKECHRGELPGFNSPSPGSGSFPPSCSDLVQEPLPCWFSLPSVKDGGTISSVPPLTCNLGKFCYLPSQVYVVCPVPEFTKPFLNRAEEQPSPSTAHQEGQELSSAG